MWVGVDPDGAVIVGFWGTGAAGTLPNQAIAQDVHASSFSRSGFGRYSVVSDIADPLRWDPFPAELATTAPWYESAHGYVRLSEHLARAPRGCIPYAFAVGPDGEIAVGMTNQGWAWNTDNPPDGTSAYTTLALFSAEGVLLWERDTQSLRRPYVVGPTTYYNDIPTSGSPVGTPNPSVNAVCFDALGNIYAGGEPNDNGDGVFKFDFDGNLLWKAKVGALVEQHAMAIDPTDGNLWVCVLRNTAWAGAEGRAAQLLKLASRDGSVLAYFDLSEAGCDPFQVAVNSRGDVLFVSDYVS